MKLEQQLREKIRSQNLADSTADAYWSWVVKFLEFAKEKRGKWVHPSELGEKQIEIFLSHLANNLNVSANTQNQAFSALCYLYRHVIGKPLENVSSLRAKRPDRIREVLDQSEIVELFSTLKGQALLAARMMYASSFRIGEVGEVRIKDISFERKQIAIRGGKGQKDRLVGFPDVLHEAVRRQIESMRVLWKEDTFGHCSEIFGYLFGYQGFDRFTQTLVFAVPPAEFESATSALGSERSFGIAGFSLVYFVLEVTKRQLFRLGSYFLVTGNWRMNRTY